MRREIFVLAFMLLFSASSALAEGVPWNKLPNVDFSKVRDTDKARAEKLMKSEKCYFECAGSVYSCVTAAQPNHTALRIAGFITRQVTRGKPDKDISKMLADRARSAHPFKQAVVSLENAFCLGDNKAPVVVVAFTDFECPFCRIVSPILSKLAAALGDKVTYCYKPFPVKGHGALAVSTSKAAVAAFELGKFWEFHDVMYEQFEAHSDGDLRGYVTKLGMDWSKFKEIRSAKDTKKKVVASKREGLKLGVKSTPTIYVNGKRYHGEKSEIELKDRIQEELDLVSN